MAPAWTTEDRQGRLRPRDDFKPPLNAAILSLLFAGLTPSIQVPRAPAIFSFPLPLSSPCLLAFFLSFFLCLNSAHRETRTDELGLGPGSSVSRGSWRVSFFFFLSLFFLSFADDSSCRIISSPLLGRVVFFLLSRETSRVRGLIKRNHKPIENCKTESWKDTESDHIYILETVTSKQTKVASQN